MILGCDTDIALDSLHVSAASVTSLRDWIVKDRNVRGITNIKAFFVFTFLGWVLTYFGN